MNVGLAEAVQSGWSRGLHGEQTGPSVWATPSTGCVGVHGRSPGEACEVFQGNRCVSQSLSVEQESASTGWGCEAECAV